MVQLMESYDDDDDDKLSFQKQIYSTPNTIHLQDEEYQVDGCACITNE
jgi:hypothetical protein